MAGPPTPLGLEDNAPRHPVKAGGGIGALVKGHRNETIGLAGGAGVIGFLWWRNRSSASGTSGTSSTGTTTSATDPTGTYDSSSIDQYNALASAISQLNSEENGLMGDINRIHKTNVRQGKAIKALQPKKKPKKPNPKTTKVNPGGRLRQVGTGKPAPVGKPVKAAVTPKTRRAPTPVR